MDLPKPPEDSELKNIIDKLANFVARNGTEFEQMTKTKQKENPKFSFLFGGEHFNYYQYRVTTEQAIMNQQKQKLAQQQQQQALVQQAIQTAPWQATTTPATATPPPVSANIQQQVAALDQQLVQHQQQMEAQAKQSEQNLAAQYQSLIQQQQVEIEEGIKKLEDDALSALSISCELPLTELDLIVQPIIDSCTKDAISAGKNWIFTHNISGDHAKLIFAYLKKRIIEKSSPFELRLHLIYLINDVLHHCVRKNAAELKEAIEVVVLPIFASSFIMADADRQQKMTKLLTLWENNSYFAPTIIEQLKDPSQAWANYQANLITQNAAVVTQITNNINERYSGLQKQHQDFVLHIQSQLQQYTDTIQQQKQQLLAPPPVVNVPPPVIPASMGPTSSAPPPPLMTFDPTKPPPTFDPSQPPPTFGQRPPGPAGPPGFDYPRGPPPPMQDFGPRGPIPDFSRPPPGFPPPGFHPKLSDADLMPSVPYYDLPAGLMAPLVKLEDCDYKSLEPNDIRLPPPCPPSDRLLAAVEAFYSPPSHEVPRDGEGWEKLGLFEFFKAKLNAKKIKEQERQEKGRSRSSSRSSSRSRSRSRSRSYSRSRSRSRSPPPYQRRSSSRSPPPHRRRRSRSPPPYQRSSRSRSRSPPPPRRRSRSATPPHLIGFNAGTSLDTRLGGENKGHMLLKKMGWGGAGLGATEQGIVEPIKQGDVRDKMDMYKGVGMNMQDPFEQFRKSRSHTFIQRMKTRDEHLKEARRKAAEKAEEEDQ